MVDAVLILNATVAPGKTLNSVVKPSISATSYLSHSSGGEPGLAFSVEMALGAALAGIARPPRWKPTAPAPAAAPLRNDRRPKAPARAALRSSS